MLKEKSKSYRNGCQKILHRVFGLVRYCEFTIVTVALNTMPTSALKTFFLEIPFLFVEVKNLR